MNMSDMLTLSKHYLVLVGCDHNDIHLKSAKQNSENVISNICGEKSVINTISATM